MAKIVASQTVSNPQMIDFVNMAKSANAGNPASNLQIDKKGRLYISKKRGNISDKLTRTVVKFGLKLGISSIESSLRIHDRGRANDAAKKFVELARAHLAESGGYEDFLAEVQISTAASYDELFSNLPNTSEPLSRAINGEIASQHKLNPRKFSGAKAIWILQQNDLKYGKMKKEDMPVFAHIYNCIVDKAVSSAVAHIDADEIKNAVQQENEFLNILIDNPGFTTKISKYHTDVGRCFNDICSAYENKDASALARNITAFCCIHNGFMQENAEILGRISGNSTSSQAMLGIALRKAEQDMLAAGIDQTMIRKIFTGLQFKIISPVFNDALSIVEKHGTSGNVPIINSDQFRIFSDISNFDSETKLTDMSALQDLQSAAEQLHPYNFDNHVFNAEFYDEKVNVSAGPENVREGARLYVQNYIGQI